ncbi:hypothetical protein LBMAG53_31580 [Planctomycetota bacterium]|nr:hypothetical protein LBMAG53_31580 [Planctomycetota bacterium]
MLLLGCLGLAPTTAAAAEPTGPAQIDIDLATVTNPDYLGFGFHVFDPMHSNALTDTICKEVLYKRWLELRPSFARLTHYWGTEQQAPLKATILMMKRTRTLVYLTTWDVKAFPPGAERQAYAVEVAKMLGGLRNAGCDNLRWYCMANELPLSGDVGNRLKLSGWASLRNHKDIFVDYHRLIHAELVRQQVDVGLLAMDASDKLGIKEAQWAFKGDPRHQRCLWRPPLHHSRSRRSEFLWLFPGHVQTGGPG